MMDYEVCLIILGLDSIEHHKKEIDNVLALYLQEHCHLIQVVPNNAIHEKLNIQMCVSNYIWFIVNSNCMSNLKENYMKFN